MKKMDVNLFLRAIAILSVVFNHSYIDRYLMDHTSVDNIFFGLSLSGGATVLLLLSGYNFAEFILSQNNAAAMRASIWKLTKKIAIPSFLLVVFFFVILSKFDIYELLFIRNWVDSTRIAKYPTWYPQVMIQMLLFFIVILPLFFKYIKNNPWLFSLLSFFLSIGGFLTTYYLLKIDMWEVRLPHLYFWIFILGWLIFYARRSENKIYIFITIVLLITSSLWIITSDKLMLYWIVSSGLLLLFCKDIKVPKTIKPILNLVAQATFTLFLFHRFFFEIFERIAPYKYGYGSLFIFSVCASLSLWITGTAFKRVYKRNI